jgi:hypothetical protein
VEDRRERGIDSKQKKPPPVAGWRRCLGAGAYLPLQQSLVQVLGVALQQAPQLAHFSAAWAVTVSAATEATAMRVRMVFMVLDVLLCFEVPAGRIRHAAQALCMPVCHELALELAVRPDDRAGQSGGGASGGRTEWDHCPERLTSRRMA